MNKRNSILIILLVAASFVSQAFTVQDSTETRKTLELFQGVYVGAEEAAFDVEYVNKANNNNVTFDLRDFFQGKFKSLRNDMTIRGKRSLENEGMYVLIDGIPGSINSVTYEEVESIQVLKESVATAIYGQKGANGVMLIKTKTGHEGELKVNVNYQHSIQTPFGFPKKLDAADYARAYNEALILDGEQPRYRAAEIELYENGKYPYLYPNVDWYDEMVRKSTSSRKLSAEFSGGSSKIRYYSVLSYNVNGSLKNELEGNTYDYNLSDKARNFRFRSNLDIDMGETTNIKLRLGGHYKNAYVVGEMYGNMVKQIGALPANEFPIRHKDGIWGASVFHNSNPYANVVDAGYNYHHSKALNVGVEFNQDLKMITPGLAATVIGSYDANVLGYDNNGRGYEREYYTANYDEVNDKFWGSVKYLFGENKPIGFSAGEGNQDKVYNLRFLLKYYRQWKNHSLNTFVQMHTEDKMYREVQKTFFNQTFSAYAHYAYKNKYLLDLSVTHTGYSTYRPENRWNTAAPSFSAAWVVSNEDWMSSLSAIDHLKLRVNAGTSLYETWNNGSPHVDYGWMGMYHFGVNDNSADGLGEAVVPNFNILPEKAETQGLGLDLTFLKDFSFSFDYWQEKRMQIKIAGDNITSALYGHKDFKESAGQVDSWGYEASLQYNKQLGDWGINARLNYNFFDTEVIENGEANKAFAYQSGKGKPIDQNWGYVANGFWKNQAEIDANTVDYQLIESLKPGDVKYVDQNGDNIINGYDMVAMGDGWMPNVTFSMDLGLTYKCVGMNVFVDGIAKVDGFDKTYGLDIPFAKHSGVTELTNERWTPATHATAKYPRNTITYNNNNHQSSTIYLRDKSYIKLRKVDLFYNLNDITIYGKKICDARFFVSANNLFSISDYGDRDPQKVGFEPATRSYSFGCNLKF